MGEDTNWEIDERDDVELDGHDYSERVAPPGAPDPDVLVDLPKLAVEEVELDVKDLRAEVSLQASVLNLLRLQVGAEASLGGLQLTVKSVEAEAQVRVRLDDLATILDRVLTTIDRNPQIIEHLVAGVGEALEELGEGTGEAVGELGAGAREAVEEVGRGAHSALDDVGEGAGRAVTDVGAGARSVAEGAASAAEDVGEGARAAAENVSEAGQSAVENLGGDAPSKRES